MPPDPNEILEQDRIRLVHMLRSAQRALRIAGALTAEALRNDDVRLLAVIKSIEVIGEAATRVSEAT